MLRLLRGAACGALGLAAVQCLEEHKSRDDVGDEDRWQSDPAPPLSLGLRYVVVVHRHGARTPVRGGVEGYGVCHHADTGAEEPCGRGQLTPVGETQLHNLGQQLRRRYVEYTRFLPPSFAPDALYVRSTNISRTVSSVKHLLVGLYPDIADKLYDPQFFKIERLSEKVENLYPNFYQCRRLRELYLGTRASEASKAYLSQPDAITLREYAMQTLHVPANHQNWIYVNDIIMSRRIHDKPLGISPRASSRMEEFAVHDFRSLVAGSAEALRLGVGGLLHDIVSRLERAMAGTEPTKLAIYSGHDTTLVGLLSALGVFDQWQWPPFAACTVIELYQQQESGEKSDVLAPSESTAAVAAAAPDGWFVRVVYNEREVAFAPFDKFLEQTAGTRLEFGSPAWLEACVQKTPDKLPHFEW